MPAPFFFKEEYPLKMKKTDIGVVGFMYAVCAFFYVYSYQLTAESKKYPMFTIILLFGLTTLYLVQMIIAARKFGVESGVNEVFEGFDGWKLMIDLRCRKLTEYLIYQLKNEDGTKCKAKVTDAKTGVKYEKYGHLSDCLDYLLCYYLRDSWTKYKRGDGSMTILSTATINEGFNY